MHFQITYTVEIGGIPTTCVCTEQDSRGNCYGFTITEAQARDRVQALANVGIVATYEPIDAAHWVNNWIG